LGQQQGAKKRPKRFLVLEGNHLEEGAGSFGTAAVGKSGPKLKPFLVLVGSFLEKGGGSFGIAARCANGPKRFLVLVGNHSGGCGLIWDSCAPGASQQEQGGLKELTAC
jgi:hypothetical protein